MKNWHFNPDYRGGEVERQFGSLSAVFEAKGEQLTWSPISTVIRLTVDGRRFYVKRYAGNGKNLWRRWFGLRAFFGLQRVKKEWENLLAFRAMGLPTATLIGYGLERNGGAFVRGALVTEELPNTLDMDSLAQSQDPRLKDRCWVAAVSRQVAFYTRTLHTAGFAHNDLKWRNLLVDSAEKPTVYLIDCPTGGYWFGPFLTYRKIKDLACLDKLGRRYLSRTQRLRFYLDYIGHARLSADDKQRIRKIVKFFEGRE